MGSLPAVDASFAGGMVGADGMSVTGAWPFPSATLRMNREAVFLDARWWVIGSGMHIRLHRSEVTTIFAWPISVTFRRLIFHHLEFEGSDPYAARPAFITGEVQEVINALRTLDWPAEARPRP